MTQFISISQNYMNKAARWCLKNENAEAVKTGPHAFDWKARIPGNEKLYNIDIHGWSYATFNNDWRVVLTGWGIDDWYWVNDKSGPEWQQVPLISYAKGTIFANGKWLSPDYLNQYRDNYLKNLDWANNWIYEQVGKKFSITKPVIMYSEHTAQHWIDVYKDQTYRFDTWDLAWDERKKLFDNRIDPTSLFVCTQFLGPENDYDFDAAGGSGLSVVSSFATLNLDDPKVVQSKHVDSIQYALIHEILHNIPLHHPDPEKYPNAYESIMRSARPPKAILLDHEKEKLLKSRYLN